MKYWLPISVTAVVLSAVTWNIFAQATDATKKEPRGFYVANSILAEGTKSPKARSLTIFTDSKVYDVGVAGSQLVTFDGQQGEIVLLDKKRKVKTVIGTRDLEAARERLRQWCLKQADPVLQFSGKPRFKIEKSDKGMDFRADEIEYLIDTMAGGSPEAATQYRQFSDAMVGLAVVTKSSPVPPLARLVVNRELEKHGVLPASVSVKMQARSVGDPSLHIRTHHAVGWNLRPQDQQLVRDAESFEQSFREVSLDVYFGRVRQAQASR